MDGRPIHYVARRQRSSNVGHRVYYKYFNRQRDTSRPTLNYLYNLLYYIVKRHSSPRTFTHREREGYLFIIFILYTYSMVVFS
jgi:hypothetical protein